MTEIVETCRPGGGVTYDLTDPQQAQWAEQAEADGVTWVEQTDTTRTGLWCNVHIGLYRGGKCRKHDIIVDPEHPQYGTLATLVYPSDRYPWVVVGGSRTGSYLFVAPINHHALPMESPVHHGDWPVNDRTYTRDEALANVQYSGATRITRRRDGSYTDHGTPFVLGVARYRRDWSD